MQSYFNIIRLTGGSNSLRVYDQDYEFVIGKPIDIIEGHDVTIFANGRMVSNAKEAIKILNEKNIYPSLVNVHSLKPLNEEFIINKAAKSKIIYTIEEHSIRGGLFTTISEILTKNAVFKKIIPLSIPDKYISSGNYNYMIKKLKFD